jgi:membrane protein required for colicin V production
MVFDGIVLILICISFYRGWKKGILWAIFSMVSVVIGILLSLKLSHQVADYLFKQNIMTSQYTLLISFILIFVLVVFLFRFGIKLVEKILDAVLLGWANKILGGVLYSLMTIFIVSTLVWLFNQVNILGPELKKDAKTYTYIEPISPKVIELSSDYLPLMKNLFQQIKGLTQGVAK